MIPREEAEQILKDIPVKPTPEEVSLEECRGRVLAEDIISPLDLPPFDKAAMDGYALRSSDQAEKYRIVEVIAAGSHPQRPLQPGECAKIMTGGKLPPGADRVVRREVTQEEDGWLVIVGEDKESNVCYQGEDIRRGEVVLEKGTFLRPQEVAVLASVGVTRVKVYCQPTVGLLATGSEIVSPGEPLREGQIYDSNTYSLAAQVAATGARLKKVGRGRDEPALLRRELEELLDECDLVLVSGGVSVGDYDYVPTILQELGVQIHFHKLAIKPGKPTIFGTRGETAVFGVPGNPVSTFVIFELLIKPFIFRLMGHSYQPLLLKGELAEELKRKKSRREAWLPVEYRQGQVRSLPYHGSAHIHALTRANGLIAFPRGVKILPKGSQIVVRPI
ncbi:MAG: molybdopterin molybdenumtransferase MoeA [Candidatus Aminicenantes bacterium]|nr:MAG: molybdopterin molybdenumtransferase MoeA [Candidatus Aminicenantes bacterium]RLE04986.1 MAG: molybdopterin molybdenumtransferase MoeA [Candidatus Aminicenantes bacterium]